MPVDVTALEKAEAEALKKMWRTPTGWIYPGKRTMSESNTHPKKPHPARVEELEEVRDLVFFFSFFFWVGCWGGLNRVTL